MMALSSSARKPMDSTRSTPSPIRRSSGTIFLSRASTSPCMPSRRGTEKPQMSASSTPTVRPRRARATARLTVTELLPTPPLPEAMAMTRAVSGMSVTGAGSRASRRARAMTALRLLGVHDPGGHVDPLARRGARRRGSPRRCWIWARRGQPAMVRATSTSTTPAVAQPDPGDHAQLDDVGAQLGVDHARAGRPGRRPRSVARRPTGPSGGRVPGGPPARGGPRRHRPGACSVGPAHPRQS